MLGIRTEELRKQLDTTLKNIVKDFARTGQKQDRISELCESALKSVLSRYFPKDEIPFFVINTIAEYSMEPIRLLIGFENDSPLQRYWVEPKSLADGELTLYSNIGKLNIDRPIGHLIVNFWKTFLKDLEGEVLDCREVSTLKKWLEDSSIRGFEVEAKNNGLTQISFYSSRKGLGNRTGYVHESMKKNDLLGHILVTGRLPYLREVNKFISKKEPSQTAMNAELVR